MRFGSGVVSSLAGAFRGGNFRACFFSGCSILSNGTGSTITACCASRKKSLPRFIDLRLFRRALDAPSRGTRTRRRDRRQVQADLPLCPHCRQSRLIICVNVPYRSLYGSASRISSSCHMSGKPTMQTTGAGAIRNRTEGSSQGPGKSMGKIPCGASVGHQRKGSEHGPAVKLSRDPGDGLWNIWPNINPGH